MTPKKKAMDIVDKYVKEVNSVIYAKRCALIAVELVLKAYEHVDEKIVKRKEEFRPVEEYSYWSQVLEEIKLLK